MTVAVKKYADTLNPQFVNRMRKLPVPWGPLGYVTYKRTYSRLREDLGRTEEWADSTERGINAILSYGGRFTHQEAEMAFEYIYNLKCTPPGRMLWQLGTSTVDKIGGDSLCNCWATAIKDVDSFCFAFDELMLGGGVGFSVMPSHVYKLPAVKTGVTVVRRDGNDVDFIVPDNREGWVELLRRLLVAFFETGRGFTYSTHCVRSKGERIKGFGGIASGPGDLVRGINQIAALLRAREGKHVRPIDALDVMNIIGSVVVSGNVRRSAQLAMGAADDPDYLQAKQWSKGVPNWRAMSNNSIARSKVKGLPDDFWSGYRGEGEPYGLINLDLMRSFGRLADGKDYRPDYDAVVPNPCFAGDTIIVTKEGAYEIADLVGKEVTVWDGLDWKTIDNFRLTGVDQPMLKITMQDGAELRVTPYHMMILADGSRVEAGDLTTGDELLLSDQTCDGPHVEEGAYLKGFLLGDGSLVTKCHKGPNENTFIQRPALYLYDTKYCCKARLVSSGDELKVGKVNTNAIPELSFVPCGDGRAMMTGLTVRKDALLKWAGDYKTGLPKDVFTWNRVSKCELLAGLFDADGTTLDSVNGYGYQLTSVNRRFLLSVQTLLKTIGVRSKVTLSKEGGLRLMPGGAYVTQPLYRLSVSQSGAIRLSGQVQFERLKTFTGRTTAYSVKSRAGKVVAVTPDGTDAEVFCCTVPGTHAVGLGIGMIVGQCAEQSLEDGECCDLFEMFLPRLKDRKEFVTAAKIGYKFCKTVLQLPFAWPKTQEVVRKNQRMGLSVSGFCQSRFTADDYEQVYREIEHLDERYSKRIGANQSIKLTTVKPSGTVSLLPGVTPGVHPAYSRYYIRRIRFSANDPIVPACRDAGYPVEPQYGFDGTPDHDTQIVSFPVDVGEETLVAAQVSAVEQLEKQRFLQTHWSDNNVSVTVYYRDEEMPAIKDWLKDNYETQVKTVSFLRHSEHGFKQAPYEEISKEQYRNLSQQVRPLTTLNDQTQWDMLDSGECAGGACPIK